jgi:hypothetical protein
MYIVEKTLRDLIAEIQQMLLLLIVLTTKYTKIIAASTIDRDISCVA